MNWIVIKLWRSFRIIRCGASLQMTPCQQLWLVLFHPQYFHLSGRRTTGGEVKTNGRLRWDSSPETWWHQSQVCQLTTSAGRSRTASSTQDTGTLTLIAAGASLTGLTSKELLVFVKLCSFSRSFSHGLMSLHNFINVYHDYALCWKLVI